MPWSSKTFTARAEGGSHDGEEFDITSSRVCKQQSISRGRFVGGCGAARRRAAASDL